MRAVGPIIKRICVFDPGLGCWTGHWVNFNSNIFAEARERGLDYLAFGHAELDPAIIGSLPVRPTFRLLPWTGLTGNHEVDVETRSSIILDDFAGISDSFGPHDLLLFPTLPPEEFGGIVHFAARIREQKGAEIGLLVQSAEGIDIVSSQQDWATRYFRRAVASLPDPTIFRDFILLASSDDLAAQYTVVFKQLVTPLCMPTVSYSGPTIGDSTTFGAAPNAITIGYFGHSSAAKGGLFLNSIIQSIKARSTEARFILHINKNPETQNALKSFDEDQDRVLVLRGHVSRDDYYTYLAQCDIILLPYDRTKYAATPSSVLSESIIAGKVVVAPEDTWLSREIWKANAGAVMFRNFDENEITEALWNAIISLEELRPIALKAARKWRKTHSVQGFMEGLLKAVQMRAHRQTAPTLGWPRRL